MSTTDSNKEPWWREELKKGMEKGWDCPSCGKNLPSGIVGIVNHWAECGGKDFHEELLQKMTESKKENIKFGIEELKQLQEKHYGKQD